MPNSVYNPRYRESIEAFCFQLRGLNPCQPPSVVLIGSAARGKETPKSDVDLLVLVAPGSKLPPSPASFHVQVITREDSMRRLREGDDFPAWCVRYGVVVQDSGDWEEIATSPEARLWPDWRKKIPHAARRLLLATLLRKTNDEDAAAEETLYALGHTARALLLRSNVFPLSRVELIEQTEAIGFPHLSSLLRDLIYDEPSRTLITQAQLYSKKLLCHLDGLAYREFTAESTRRALTKKRKNEATLT